MKMKALKIFSISAPITACGYWLNTHKCNNPLNFTNLQAAEQNMKLEHVQIVFRHGARTPVHFPLKQFEDFSNIDPVIWDKDKLINLLPWTDIDYTVKFPDVSFPQFDTAHNQNRKLLGGCSPGMLTSVGQQELYDLGKWLSNEYVVNHGIISPKYEKKEVYIRSTNYARTIQSAVCLLAGFYGKDTLTEPVSIHTKVPEDNLNASYGCALLREWFHNLRGKIFSAEMNNEEEALNTLMGKNEDSKCKDIVSLNELIQCREAHGLEVPQYLLDKKEVIQKYAVQFVTTLLGFGNVGVIRMSIGSFIENICCRINEAIEGTNQSRMLLYSAHDWTILCVLMAFGVDIKDWPPFASHIIIELYKREDGERFIRVLYNGKPLILENEENEEYLPVAKFMRLVEMYRVLNWNKECGNDVKK